MRRTLMFDHLETRKLLSGTDPNWNPDTGWVSTPGYLDTAALDGAYTKPIYVPPAPTIVYPGQLGQQDILHTHTDIIVSP